MRRLAALLIAALALSGCAGEATNGLPASQRTFATTTQAVTTAPEEETTPVETQPAEKSYAAGYLFDLTGCTVYEQGETVWQVGRDIPAGRYMLVPKTSQYAVVKNTYSYLISLDEAGQKVVQLRAGSGNGIVSLTEGEYFSVSFCVVVPFDQCPKPQPVGGIYSEGTYLMGETLPAGSYTLTADTQEANYTIFDSLEGMTLWETKTLSSGKSKDITLLEGWVLCVNGCHFSAK